MSKYNQSQSLPVGHVLHGRYKIESLIEIGGFGITYLVYDKTLNVNRCIKELFTIKSHREKDFTVSTPKIGNFEFDFFLNKFIREARDIASLNHKNIVSVKDVFEENNTAYIVMDYIDGIPLSKYVQNNKPLAYDTDRSIFIDILESVEYIHSRGILHRDIKPENILITADKNIILIDFGNAKSLINNTNVSEGTIAIFTPGYAAPEQYNENHEKGTYTDIYSIGATFYFLLTGEKPPDAPALSIGKNIRSVYDINPKVHPLFSEIIKNSMSLRPSDRYQSVKIIKSEIESLTIMDTNPPHPIGGPIKDDEQKWYLIDSKKTLLDKGIAYKKSGIIGINEKIGLNNNLNSSYFHKYNNSKNEIDVGFKKPIILSDHSPNSYSFIYNANSGVQKIHINDEELFWKNTKFLCITESRRNLLIPIFIITGIIVTASILLYSGLNKNGDLHKMSKNQAESTQEETEITEEPIIVQEDEQNSVNENDEIVEESLENNNSTISDNTSNNGSNTLNCNGSVNLNVRQERNTNKIIWDISDNKYSCISNLEIIFRKVEDGSIVQRQSISDPSNNSYIFNSENGGLHMVPLNVEIISSDINLVKNKLGPAKFSCH